MKRLTRFIAISGLFVLILIGSFFAKNSKKQITYLPAKQVKVQVSNLWSSKEKACVISSESLLIKSIDDTKYAFCYEVPVKSVCLYLKADNSIRLRSFLPEQDCQKIPKKKTCYVVDDKLMTCAIQTKPLN